MGHGYNGRCHCRYPRCHRLSNTSVRTSANALILILILVVVLFHVLPLVMLIPACFETAGCKAGSTERTVGPRLETGGEIPRSEHNICAMYGGFA